jgi:hypothetical protein
MLVVGPATLSPVEIENDKYIRKFSIHRGFLKILKQLLVLPVIKKVIIVKYINSRIARMILKGPATLLLVQGWNNPNNSQL